VRKAKQRRKWGKEGKKKGQTKVCPYLELEGSQQPGLIFSKQETGY
jgi:hypothetical protein